MPVARNTLLHVVVIAVQEDDHVRVLLDRSGLAQVGHDRALVGAFLDLAIELAQQDHRDSERLGEPFQFARDVAVLGRFLRLARPTHDVQMIDPDGGER